MLPQGYVINDYLFDTDAFSLRQIHQMVLSISKNANVAMDPDLTLKT